MLFRSVTDAMVFHAGTAVNDSGRIAVSGGRVFAVTATGSDLINARERAYAAVGQIHFAGEHHRTDIAQRAATEHIEVP